MSTPQKEREISTPATGSPGRDAGQQASTAPERPADDHVIRGYN